LTGVPLVKTDREETGRSIPLTELKEMLAAAPDKTLNIRKEGLQLANIKTLARSTLGCCGWVARELGRR
jgi:hypothetical protein